MGDDWVELEVERVIKETAAAFLLQLEGGNREWMPKSQIRDPDGLSEGEVDLKIEVTQWVCDQKGI